jgi:hypothetical protein
MTFDHLPSQRLFFGVFFWHNSAKPQAKPRLETCDLTQHRLKFQSIQHDGLIILHRKKISVKYYFYIGCGWCVVVENDLVVTRRDHSRYRLGDSYDSIARVLYWNFHYAQLLIVAFLHESTSNQPEHYDF